MSGGADAAAAAPSSLCQAVEALAEEARRARALKGAAAALLARFSALRALLLRAEGTSPAPSSFSAEESERDARLERELGEALRMMDDAADGSALLLPPPPRGVSPPPLARQPNGAS